ncbi:MAG: asparagine synthase (glutamine-hydrolyzing) [Desulfobulbaceae bacterium]|nr:asparagine synthase (glutamine-hydrolyzing) [Desulfobulbaceae bacterium]
MCGIAGQFFNAPYTPNETVLAAMGSAMQYRGPDDEGLYCAPHIGLVHRRLSIRDLSPAGRCPMSSADGSIQILFNGEIYNWRELRAELEASGYPFFSQSDTEVILRGYEAWVEALIPRLRGMFAIAIWDGKQQRLLLARDRAGEKPLYYHPTETGLAFGSSIEAITSVLANHEIDPVAIACYLVHSFIPHTRTVWQDIRVLPPAHMLVVAPGNAPEIRTYWDFPRILPCRKMNLQTCMHSIEAVVEDSVVRCLDADVPVGVFLSGGVDSSLLAAMAARHKPGLPAFSLGFNEKDLSELPYARKVAAHLGLPHYYIEIDAQDVLSCLPHLVVQYGQPFGDASAVPSFLVAKLAREHVKVCISGDGGDESFGGYWRMQSGVYANRYGSWIPRILRENVVPFLAKRFGGVGRRWAAMNQLSLAAPGTGYTNSMSWLHRLGEIAGPCLQLVINDDLTSFRVGKSLARSEASIVQRILYDDFQVQLPDDYLTKVDVASMAASLEVRAPFLDQQVIEAAWSLPDGMKLHWGQLKWLLKHIAARWVPPEVVYRPKMGFAMPLEHWWRGILGNCLENLLNDSVAESEGWIQVAPVRRLLAEHRRGRDHHTRLWLVLWLELWFRLVVQHVDPSHNIME